jgi:competence protein ComGC
LATLRRFGWTNFLAGRKVENMKPRFRVHKIAALTLTELLLAIFVIAVLVVLSLPGLAHYRVQSPRRSCVNNLKQVSLAYWIWAGDNNGRYPMEVSATNGGTMEFAMAGDVVKTFQIMSNELSTPKVLYCPYDSQRTNAAHFETLMAKNIS